MQLQHQQMRNQQLTADAGIHVPRFSNQGTARCTSPASLGPRATRQYNDEMDWADLPADQLLQACGQPHSSGAWEEFMRRYHPLLTSAGIRVSHRWGNGSSQEIDDIVQEMYLKLCADGARILTRFQATTPDSVFGYLKVVATNLAHDYFRKRSASKRGAWRTASLDEVRDVAAAGSDLDQQLALAEVDKLLLSHTQTQNGSRDRGIFRLYYQHGLTAQAIAELPGVQLSPKGVEGVLHRLTKAVRQTLQPKQESGHD